MNILYVDDEIDIIEVARIYFNDHGIKIDTASDVTEAIELVKNKKYSLIISDARMPRIDGLSFNRMLRDQLGYEGTFILVTGYYDYIDALVFPPGIDKVLIKPIEFDDLLKIIQELNIKSE